MIALAFLRALDVVAPPRPVAVLQAPSAHALWGLERASCPAAETCEPCVPCDTCEVCEATPDSWAADGAVHLLGAGVRTALSLLSELTDGALVGAAVLLSTSLATCCSCCLIVCPRRARGNPTAQTRLAAYRR